MLGRAWLGNYFLPDLIAHAISTVFIGNIDRVVAGNREKARAIGHDDVLFPIPYDGEAGLLKRPDRAKIMDSRNLRHNQTAHRFDKATPRATEGRKATGAGPEIRSCLFHPWPFSNLYSFLLYGSDLHDQIFRVVED